MRRQQEDLALADRHVIEIAGGGVMHLQQHVAFHLVEEFLDRIVVVVGATVRATDHGDHQVGVLEHKLIADRRLQEMRVFVDPLREIECRKALSTHGFLLHRMGRATARSIFM